MNSRVRKIVVVVSLLLAAFTFVSKSILYWSTPKVTAVTIAGGSIKYRNHISESRVVSGGMEKIQLPASLPEGIAVVWMLDGEQKPVKTGEALLRADESSVKKHAAAAEKKYFETLDSATMFRKNYPVARESAQKAFDVAKKNLGKAAGGNAKRAEQYQLDYQIAEEILYQLDTLGIYEANSLSNLEKQRDMAKAEADGLQAFLDDQCAIRSPCDGTLMSWPAGEALTHLPPNRVLFEILPDRAPWVLEVSVYGDVYLNDESESVMLTNLDNPLDRMQLDVLTIEKKGDRTVMVLSGADRDASSCLSLDNYVLTYESPFYNALVPNNAFISDTTVLSVQTVYTDNRVQNQLREITVKKAPGNATHTPVLSGLTGGMRLVTAWDRNIADGDIVIVKGE